VIATPPNQEVVHLVAPPDASGSGRLLPVALCASAIRAGHVPHGQVVIIGDTSAADTAKTLGIHRPQRISPILHNHRFCARLLRSSIPESAHIICWNDELAGFVADAGASSELISTAPHLAPRLPQSRTMIRVLDETDRDAWVDLGRDAILDRDLPALVDSFSPCMDRAGLRARLELDPQTILLGALSDNPATTDAREFSFLLGLLSAAGYRVAGLLPASARYISPARRHHRALHEPFRIFTTTDPILANLPAIDLMLHINHHPSGSAHLLERLCENAGTPVMRLTHAGRKGLACSPGESVQLIQRFDQLVRERMGIGGDDR